jgi:hypothetical protein
MPRLMKRTPVAAPEQNSNNGVLAAQADLEAAVAEVARVRGQLLTGGVLSAGAIDALAQAWLRQKQRRGTFESYLQRMGLIDAAQLQRLSVPGEEVQPVSPSTDAASTSLPQVAISDESATAAPSLPPSSAEPDADELEISAQVDEEAPRQPSLPQDFIAGLDESDQVSQPTTVLTLRSGSRFGRYLLEEELGRGATATIFRSFHDTMHIPVAVKIFSPLGASDDPAEAERFLTEARLLAKLDHPSIVRVLDVALRGRLPYIVFEYVGELSLEDLLDNILVLAEVESFKANPKGPCIGTVVEAELDKFRGVTATLLVQNGTMHRGDTIVVGKTWGRIKAMFDYEGKALQEAGPSTPVVVLGLQEVPNAGDVFERVMNDKDARGARRRHTTGGHPSPS